MCPIFIKKAPKSEDKGVFCGAILVRYDTTKVMLFRSHLSKLKILKNCRVCEVDWWVVSEPFALKKMTHTPYSDYAPQEIHTSQMETGVMVGLEWSPTSKKSTLIIKDLTDKGKS